jgi:hypothetical protein
MSKPAELPAPPPPALAPPEAPVVTTPVVGVDAAVAQAKSLLPADASPALLVGAAAGFAVLAAAFKMGPKFLKARAEKAEQEHELEMRRLELEEKKVEQDSKKQDDSHQQCSTARGLLEARVGQAEGGIAELKSGLTIVSQRIDAIDSKKGGLELDIDDKEAEDEPKSKKPAKKWKDVRKADQKPKRKKE